MPVHLKGVDGRDKPGHDGAWFETPAHDAVLGALCDSREKSSYSPIDNVPALCLSARVRSDEGRIMRRRGVDAAPAVGVHATLRAREAGPTQGRARRPSQEGRGPGP